MLPLRDNIPSRSTPIVNYTLIGICTLVFVAQLQQPPGEGGLVDKYGMIPARVVHPNRPVTLKFEQPVRTPFGMVRQVSEREIPAPSFNPMWTLLTCIFLHGGWMHIIGNLWFLYIFGDNVEDRFGHLGYLAFYLGSGVAASLFHLLANLSSTLPTIGASGAIAGVMGAYLLLYPHARVLTLVPIFFFIQILVLPAPLLLGVWFLIQFLEGTTSSAQQTGVAWWAHIGGFVTGIAVAWALQRMHVLRPKVEETLPNTDHVTYYRIPRRERP